MEGIYNGDSLKTYEKITNNIKSYYANTLYHNTKYDNYFFINSKGYLHCYISEKRSIDEYMLTKNNTLKWIRKVNLASKDEKKEFIEYLKNAKNI